MRRTRSAGALAPQRSTACTTERQAAATQNVRRLEAERRRCAAVAEKRARRLVERSAAVGDVASRALPFLARKASQEFKEASLEKSVRERSEDSARAKASVKQAMNELERISLEIMQAQQPPAPAPASTDTPASPPPLATAATEDGSSRERRGSTGARALVSARRMRRQGTSRCVGTAICAHTSANSAQRCRLC